MKSALKNNALIILRKSNDGFETSTRGDSWGYGVDSTLLAFEFVNKFKFICISEYESAKSASKRKMSLVPYSDSDSDESESNSTAKKLSTIKKTISSKKKKKKYVALPLFREEPVDYGNSSSEDDAAIVVAAKSSKKRRRVDASSSSSITESEIRKRLARGQDVDDLLGDAARVTQDQVAQDAAEIASRRTGRNSLWTEALSGNTMGKMANGAKHNLTSLARRAAYASAAKETTK